MGCYALQCHSASWLFLCARRTEQCGLFPRLSLLMALYPSQWLRYFASEHWHFHAWYPLAGSGISFKRLANHAEYVFPAHVLHAHSLFGALVLPVWDIYSYWLKKG